jgi:hypothetical protein
MYLSLIKPGHSRPFRQEPYLSQNSIGYAPYSRRLQKTGSATDVPGLGGFMTFPLAGLFLETWKS